MVFGSFFDMRLFGSTAVSGAQVIKADEPRSIIYAVILHEVCSALYWARKGCGNAERVSRSPHFRDYFPRGRGSWRAGEAGCPIKAAGIGGPCLKRASRAATARRRNSA